MTFLKNVYVLAWLPNVCHISDLFHLKSITILLMHIFIYTVVSQMKNLRYHFPTCSAYSVKRPIGELNLKRALDEDTYK